MLHAGPNPPPRRLTPYVSIFSLFAAARGLARYLATRSGGLHHNITNEFVKRIHGLKLVVIGNQGQQEDWPTYQDVLSVITGLESNIGDLEYMETDAFLWRTGTTLTPFGFAYLVRGDRQVGISADLD